MIKLTITFFSALIIYICLPMYFPAQAVTKSTSNKVSTRVGNPSTQLPSDGTSGPPPSDIRQGIIDKFHITMNGFDDQYLTWAWEKFGALTNTKFLDLVNGSVIERLPGTSGSYQHSCPSDGDVDVFLAQYTYGEEWFKYIITHELGHVVRNCNSREAIQYSQHVNAYDSEGAISYYGSHAYECTKSENYSEDYADMIAYYLNPQAGLSTSGCGGNAPANPPNPYFATNPPEKPQHLQVVKTVLDK